MTQKRKNEQNRSDNADKIRKHEKLQKRCGQGKEGGCDDSKADRKKYSERSI